MSDFAELGVAMIIFFAQPQRDARSEEHGIDLMIMCIMNRINGEPVRGSRLSCIIMVSQSSKPRSEKGRGAPLVMAMREGKRNPTWYLSTFSLWRSLRIGRSAGYPRESPRINGR